MGKGEGKWNRDGKPLSPVSEIMANPNFNLCIHVVFHFHRFFQLSEVKQIVVAMHSFIPSLPYALRKDKSGVVRWRKAELNVEDHIVLVEPPSELQKYEEFVDDYIMNMPMMSFDQSKPQWDVHLINGRTSRGESTLVMRFHHSLGDGISLMSALLQLASSVDDPLRMPTFPRQKPKPRRQDNSKLRVLVQSVKKKLTITRQTFADAYESFLSSKGFLQDTSFPTKRPLQREPQPWIAEHAYTSFLLQEVKSIKNRVEATLNDVLCGIIFYAYQQYLEIRLAADEEKISVGEVYSRRSELLSGFERTKKWKKVRVSSFLTVNVRRVPGLQNMTDMVKKKTEVPWGNRLTGWSVPVLVGEMEDPLKAVRMAKRVLDKKKKSVIALLMYKYCKIGFAEANAKSYNRFVSSTSLLISNVVGPSERVSMVGNRVNNFTFFVAGMPQAAQVYIISYVDEVQLHVAGLTPYVDGSLLCRCLNDAFADLKQCLQ